VKEKLPPDLQALVEESLDVTVDDRRVRTIYRDVSVVEEPTASRSRCPSYRRSKLDRSTFSLIPSSLRRMLM